MGIHGKNAAGFSLIEMLLTIAVMSVLYVCTTMAFTSVDHSGRLTKASNDISGLIEQARAYAMAQNTYVWIGFRKEGTDSLAVGVVASINGEAKPAATDATAASTDIVQLGRIKRFTNIQMVAAPSSTNRPQVDPKAQLASSEAAILAFAAGKGENRVNFDTQVVQINSRGEARVLSGQLLKLVEIGLQSSANGIVRSPNDYAALQLNELSGSVSVYRP